MKGIARSDSYYFDDGGAHRAGGLGALDEDGAPAAATRAHCAFEAELAAGSSGP